MMGNSIDSQQYDSTFYRDIMNGSRLSAIVIVPYILALFPDIKTVSDFGCGAGAWLKEFELAGMEIQGYDFGVGVPENLLIPIQCFSSLDMTQHANVERKFDLALSLEVAEHIDARDADSFINLLTSSADVIVFSAAVPNQGGTDHKNEQWPAYWVKKFELFGFSCFDILRPVFWHDSRIEFWYRQNIMLYLSKKIVDHYPQLSDITTFHYFPFIHPDLFLCEK